jgi:hypothetical protein
VDPFDALELDIARRRRAADPGLGPDRVETGECRRDAAHDLTLVDDTDVQIRKERDRVPALSGEASSTMVPVWAIPTAQPPEVESGELRGISWLLLGVHACSMRTEPPDVV